MKRTIHKQKLEHVPELLHCIQSLLPPIEAARTCVLSKSWMHAWSTIPNLRFPKSGMLASQNQKRDILKVVENTPLRYIRDDIPFEKIDLSIDIENHELACFAKKWIRLVATKSCLKELCLSIGYGSIRMPDEIFSSNKLYKMSITGLLLINRNPAINCVALRVLELCKVDISEDVFEKLLSTCIFLQKIKLSYCKGLKNIKVRNLPYLSELRFQPEHAQIVEIYDVPNFRSFHYSSDYPMNPLILNIDSVACVTELTLDGYFMDESFFDMLKSKFHFLESLTLEMRPRKPRFLEITCPPLKRLHIITLQSFTRIIVYAPKLHFFRYHGIEIPSLMFPAIAPAQIKLQIYISNTDVDLFFVKIAEAFMLSSSEFDIEISIDRFDLIEPLKIDMDDLRTRFKIPATNVQNLSVQTFADKGLGKHSLFFDAFFSICNPKHVVSYQDLQYTDSNYFCQLMLKEVMEKKTGKGSWRDYLREVEIENDLNCGNWETLTNSWKSCLDRTSLSSYKFRLHWC